MSGTIYSRALGASELAVYYVNVYASAYPHIRLTSGSQTAPGVGEFGVSGTTLYLNINANPNGQTVNYAWGKCGGIIVEDCESYDNYWDQSAMYHEGHGFAFDDYSDDSQFLRNLSYNNQGGGFSINRGDRSLLRGNVAYGNCRRGWSQIRTSGLNACNNTFFANNAAQASTMPRSSSTATARMPLSRTTSSCLPFPMAFRRETTTLVSLVRKTVSTATR